jgi:hypothetical protein
MANDLVITGIPRSGTSYMCSILNEVEDIVVVNEPDEVFQLMQNTSDVPMSKYYDLVRERIINNLPIKNKIADGKFIEDTNVLDVTEDYLPDVNLDNFILGTKNTLIYLSALERLKNQFQNQAVVVCVRNPIDTIASWSNVSFPHIKNVEMSFLLEYSDDFGKKAINRVMNKNNLAQRYAMWWDYLAKVILKNASDIIIVRYEDMVVNPLETINKICESMSFDIALSRKIEPSSPRSHRDQLSSEIIKSINNYCKNSAKKLGYKL